MRPTHFGNQQRSYFVPTVEKTGFNQIKQSLALSNQNARTTLDWTTKSKGDMGPRSIRNGNLVAIHNLANAVVRLQSAMTSLVTQMQPYEDPNDIL